MHNIVFQYIAVVNNHKNKLHMHDLFANRKLTMQKNVHSYLPFSCICNYCIQWYEIIGESTIADAIMDRLVDYSGLIGATDSGRTSASYSGANGAT